MHKNAPKADLHLKEDLVYYDQQTTQLIAEFFPLVRKKITTHSLLHLTLLTLAFGETLLLLFGLSTLAEYAMISAAISGLFLTLFAYFILRLYTQTKKTEQIKSLLSLYINNLQELVDYQDDLPECNIVVANGCCKFAELLKDQEYSFFKPPRLFAKLNRPMRKLSCLCFWQNIADIRESLLQSSITEQIKWVKSEATNLEAHASLANAYVLLSQLYASLLTQRSDDGWIASKNTSLELSRKFLIASRSAIEEFKILKSYAPNDPWIHEQLAYSYRDLNMPLEEIHEYEQILHLNPSESEILFKLGVLYFQLGRNADGLQTYENLRKLHTSKSESLISYYGAYTTT